MHEEIEARKSAGEAMRRYLRAAETRLLGTGCLYSRHCSCMQLGCGVHATHLAAPCMMSGC
jgi:hypothetical protein